MKPRLLLAWETEKAQRARGEIKFFPVVGKESSKGGFIMIERAFFLPRTRLAIFVASKKFAFITSFQ